MSTEQGRRQEGRSGSGRILATNHSSSSPIGLSVFTTSDNASTDETGSLRSLGTGSTTGCLPSIPPRPRTPAEPVGSSFHSAKNAEVASPPTSPRSFSNKSSMNVGGNHENNNNNNNNNNNRRPVSLNYATVPVSLNYEGATGEGAVEVAAHLSPTKYESVRDVVSKYCYSSSSTSKHKNNTRSPSGSSNNTVADVENGVMLRDGPRLDPDTDPFAVREGRTLTWKNVNMSLRATKNKPAGRKLLDNVWGEVPKKETTAILGASGAGKTSLLNILAGRLRSNKTLRVETDVRLNNYSVDPTNITVRQNIAFVAQDDSLQITSTPREAIRFSAKMRLSRTTTEDQLDQLTNRMLIELGLVSCADTIVGGALIKGISGGERKRTSVGVELVVRPTLVFLDEPTSGLDSFSAEQCCEVLKKVAHAGASVLFTIHQPASEVFAAFDHLILLNKGRVMYQGPVNGIPNFFGACGYPVPRNYNPADWIIDVAQGVPIKTLDEAGFFPEDPRKMGEAFQPEKGQDVLGRTVRLSRLEGLMEPPPGTLKQIQMLFRRELLHICRDWTVSFARVFLVAILSFFIGMIFFKVGDADQRYRMNVQSQFGAIVTILVSAMIFTSQIALFSFPDERPVFLREYSTNHYSVVSYFVAHLTTEFVLTAVQVCVMVLFVYYFVGFEGRFITYFLSTYALAMTTTAQAVFGSCLAGSNTKLAMQMLPLLFTPQMLFSGFFVSPDLIPSWLSWAPYVCTMTYSTRILVVEEFENCSNDPADLVNCDDMLNSTNSDPNEVWWYWIALGALFVVFRVAALVVLQRSALKFY